MNLQRYAGVFLHRLALGLLELIHEILHDGVVEVLVAAQEST